MTAARLIRLAPARAEPVPREPGDPTPLARGPLVMDPLTHEVRWRGRPVRLTSGEWRILWAMARRPGVVWSRDRLMDAAYGIDGSVDERTMDSHIKRLRSKLRAVDESFAAIETIYGLGYRINVEATR